MATITRKNAWNNNGTFANPDLLWYAKGVRVMQSRTLNDPTSWWFFAAMHGEYITSTPPGSLAWSNVPGVPHVPLTPLPTPAVRGQYWNQCQHFTWYFAPWHRGYLYALENILRVIIKDLGGPTDWALPYWNYFGPNNQFRIPPAFTQHNLPDGTANPLFVTARYGSSGNIFVDLSRANQKCQNTTNYTGSAPDFYGGGKTGFSHFGPNGGALEYNPHNGVHGMIGGRVAANMGLMSDPGTAALDPVFYLHHCNIDRLWAIWNKLGRKNPIDPDWLAGPTAVGARKFYMPKPDKSAWQFTPAMVKDISLLHYTYFDMGPSVPIVTLSTRALRMRTFGLPPAAAEILNEVELDEHTELMGANTDGAIKLDNTGAHTTVKLNATVMNTVKKSFNKMHAATPATPALPDEVYLELEGIKGNVDANEYSVTVNHQFVGHVFLFGLSLASMKDGEHGGAGLNIVFNITSVIDKLHLSNVEDLSSLEVVIQPSTQTYEGDKCSVDRIAIYRKGQKNQ